MWTTPFLIFIIDVSTQIVKHRKALQSADFYGILNGRKGAVLQVQRSCFPPDVKSGGSSFFVVLRMVRLYTHENPKEEIQYGYFKYSLFRSEPFGYSHHRCHQCDVDDLKGRLSGQTSSKALF